MAERHSKEVGSPLNLRAFLPHAAAQLQAPFDVRVLEHTQDEYVSKTADDKLKRGKSAKSTVQHASLDSPTRREESASAVPAFATDDDEQEVVITLVTVYDTAGNLVELRFDRERELPRLLLKIIALCVPFHPALTGFTARRSSLGGGALHEIAKIIPLSQITEVCLDDSPVGDCDYGSLLAEPAQLRILSLARCVLGDTGCALIAGELCHPRPAARSLLMLTLAGDGITDVGAAALAAALRGNRALQYLNLCGNRITDDGAGRILDSLAEFPLTYEEIVTKRRCFLEYIKLRDEVTRRCHLELVTAERAPDEASRGGRRRQTTAGRGRRTSAERRTPGANQAAGTSATDPLELRAQMMAAELVGPPPEPFGADETVSRDGCAYSVGNTTLCALNLAYNELGYASVVRLLAVLQQQAALGARGGGGGGGARAGGLVHVCVEGCPVPRCAELGAVQQQLERALAGRAARPPKSKLERTSAKSKSR